MRLVVAAIPLALVTAACAGPAPIELSFRPEQVMTGSEDYLCFGFDAARLAGLAVERIAWSPPAGGGVSLHHATVYALPDPFPDGPLSCAWMPANAVGLHVWAPGDEPLVMPEGSALSIPEGTSKIVIQAHVLRSSEALADEVSVALTPASGAPEHLAAWHSTFTPVPPIPPHDQASSSSLCRARADVHAIFAWPHMHRLGKSFHSAIRRAGGGTTTLVDLPAWDVAREVTYPISVDIQEGDEIETRCTWENTGAEVVHDGLYTTDEMCTHGLVSWPASAPRCERL